MFHSTWSSSIFLKYLLHILFPVSCPICGRAAETACRECLEKLRRNVPPCGVICFECGLSYPCGLHASPWIYHYACHEGKARDLVLSLKYTGQAAIGREMGKAIGNSIENMSGILNMKDSILIPIPLHRKSVRKFNQSLSIAKGISDICGLGVSEALRWTADIEGQSGKSRSERLNLPKNIFEATRAGTRKIHGKKIILVDDVLTTGTTVRRAQHACESAGATVAGIFVWTRTV